MRLSIMLKPALTYAVVYLFILSNNLCSAQPSPWKESDVWPVFDRKVTVADWNGGIYHIEITQGGSTGTHQEPPSLTMKVIEVMHPGDINLRSGQEYKAVWLAHDIQSFPRMSNEDYNEQFWKDFSTGPPTGRKLLVQITKPSKVELPIELTRRRIYEASSENLQRARAATSEIRAVDFAPEYIFKFLMLSPIVALGAFFLSRGMALAVGLLSVAALFMLSELLPSGSGLTWAMIIPSLIVLCIIVLIDIGRLLSTKAKKTPWWR
jgi:hypothetical protein